MLAILYRPRFFLCLSGILFFLFACQESVQEKIVVEKYPSGKKKREKIYNIHPHTSQKKLWQEITYYENGHIQIKGHYQNGLMHGPWAVYYENGILWSEGYFKNGKRDSVARVYYPSGNLRYEGMYKNGKQTGTWKFYAPDGKITQILTFDE